MKDKLYTGLIPGLLAPFLVIALFYLFRFSYLTPGEFIQQAFTLKVYLKIIAVGIFLPTWHFSTSSSITKKITPQKALF